MEWPSELSARHRLWLRIAFRIVPEGLRDEWRREWAAELAYTVEKTRGRAASSKARVVRGMLVAAGRDALWLRSNREPLRPGHGRRPHRPHADALLAFDLEGDRGDSMASKLARDFRLAFRRLARTPRYALLVVLVLGLGIGATMAVATLVEAVLLRPLPYAEGARVVRALAFDPGERKLDWVSWAQVQTFRNAASFDAVAASTTFPATWKRDSGSTRIQRAFVSNGYFELLGVRAFLGGDLALDEGAVVVSHRLWRRELGSRRDVLGEGMNLDGRLYEIRAVAPEALYSHDLGGVEADVWLAQSLDQTVADPDFRIFTFFGRLERGRDPHQAELELGRLQADLAVTGPELYRGWEIRVEGLHESMVGHLRGALVLLLGAVTLVLLVVATNLSNLVLSRTVSRRRELAIHVALGARVREVARSVAVENWLLALAGGVVGIGVSRIVLRLVTTLVDWPLPRQEELFVEGPRFVLPLVLSLVLAFAFGTAPALAALRRDLAPALSSSSRSATGGSRFRSLVISVQVALSVPLVMGAGLLIQSVLSLSRAEVGLAPDRVVSVRVSLPREWIGPPEPASFARVARFFEETMSEIETLPEVDAVGGSIYPPFLGEADRARFQIEGEPVPDPAEAPRALLHIATPGYFEALGTRLLSGRAFDSRDEPGSAPVAIVSAELARRAFDGRNPLGRSLTTEWSFLGSTGDAPVPRTIVGVVQDIAQLGPLQPVEPQIYVPHAQASFPSLALVVRTEGEPEALFRGIETRVRAREPLAIVEERILLRDAFRTTLEQPRFYAQSLGLFAVTAAALFALGLYGLLSYRVASRHRELGLRAALGATPGNLLASVLESALRTSGAGFLAGAVAALALAQLMRTFVHGVSVYDPLTLLATPVLVFGTALAASYFPARRAARVEVVEALRLDE